MSEGSGESRKRCEFVGMDVLKSRSEIFVFPQFAWCENFNNTILPRFYFRNIK